MVSASPAKRRRIDSLPEYAEYKDPGCCIDRSISNLQCPLPQCVLDMPCGLMTLKVKTRQVEVWRLTEDGKQPEEIALILQVSERTVFRDLARMKGR